MPPNHKGDQEARISQVIEAIHSNNSSSIHITVCIYNISHLTLTRHLHEQSTYQQSQMTNQKLLSTEEEALFQ